MPLSKLLGSSLGGSLGSLSNSLGMESSSHSAPAAHEFSVRPSPHNGDVLVIHPAGYPENAPPLYSIVTSQSSKPNVLLYRGEPSFQAVGDASVSTISSKVPIRLRGQEFRMKGSSSGSGSQTVESPAYGNLKWKASEISSGYTMFNDHGDKIAQYKSDGWTGAKKLVVFVPADGYFIEMLLLTAIAAKLQASKLNEVMSEVVSGVAGA